VQSDLSAKIVCPAGRKLKVAVHEASMQEIAQWLIREPQKILKTDERSIHIELGCEGKFTAKSSGWDEDRVFLEATSSSSRSRAAAGC